MWEWLARVIVGWMSKPLPANTSVTVRPDGVWLPFKDGASYHIHCGEPDPYRMVSVAELMGER